MAFEERVQILSEAEQDELYGPPAFTSADQRFFFSLNDKELAIAKSLRHRGQRYMLVVLLGYFKAKPVVLNPGFHQIKQDLKYVYQTVLPGPGWGSKPEPPKIPSADQRGLSRARSMG